MITGKKYNIQRKLEWPCLYKRMVREIDSRFEYLACVGFGCARAMQLSRMAHTNGQFRVLLLYILIPPF